MLWLWPAAAAPIQPLVWEHSICDRYSPEKQKKKENSATRLSNLHVTVTLRKTTDALFCSVASSCLQSKSKLPRPAFTSFYCHLCPAFATVSPARSLDTSDSPDSLNFSKLFSSFFTSAAPSYPCSFHWHHFSFEIWVKGGLFQDT